MGTFVLGGAEGERSLNGGVVGTVVLGGAPGSTIQGEACKFSNQGESLVTRTVAERLRRDNAGRAGGLGSAGGGAQTG